MARHLGHQGIRLLTAAEARWPVDGEHAMRPALERGINRSGATLGDLVDM